MKSVERLHRIQTHAHEITTLLRASRLRPDPDTAATIHDRAQLIERETILLVSEAMPVRGHA